MRTLYQLVEFNPRGPNKFFHSWKPLLVTSIYQTLITYEVK